MTDTEVPGRPDSTETTGETRNLPVPVPLAREPRDGGERWFTRLVRAVFGWKANSMRADLKVVLEAGSPGETGFSPEESTMLKNILGLRERRVEDVMVPRADIVAVQEDIPLGELIKVFENAAHSRLVVYKETLDDPTGMVHIRDLIAFMAARAAEPAKTTGKRKKPLPAGLNLKAIDLAMPLSATRIVRAALFVPPSMPAIDLLAKMQAIRIHLALVIDEYGGTDGLVSMEDIVEQIVGDIEDEHDEVGEHPIIRQSDGSYLADARASLDDVVAMVGSEFDAGQVTEEVDTLGGFIVAQVGRLPVRGELVPGPGPFEIEVLDADPRRVKRVRIHRSRQARDARNEASRRDADGVRRLAAPISPVADKEANSPAEASSSSEPPPSADAASSDPDASADDSTTSSGVPRP